VKPCNCHAARLFVFCWLLICASLASSPARASASEARRPSYTTSWIGNSFPGGVANGHPGTGKKVQSSTADMSVRPDGTVFLNTIWDESGQEGGRYKDGAVLGGSPCSHDGGGLAVTTNAKYAYLSYQLFSSHSINGVRRYDLNGNPAGGFTHAVGKCGNELGVPTNAYIPGLAASDSELYVADSANGVIRVYGAESMAPLRQFRFPHPLKLAYDPATTSLWIARKGGIENYSTSGQFLGRKITGIADPGGLAIDNQGRILVADSGPQQRIRIYSRTGESIGTLGAGIYSGKPGQVQDSKLVNPVAVGSDGQGNLYVAGGASLTDLRKFSPTGKMLWALRGLVFVDSAAVDGASGGRDVYTLLHHFRMNYALSGGGEWTWAGYTIDPFRYPDDPRLFAKEGGFLPTAHAVRRLNGHKYLFTTDQFSHTFLIFRLDGEIAVPAGGFGGRPIPGWAIGSQPSRNSWSPAWMWIDSNDNGVPERGEFTDLNGLLNDATWGWDVDDKGNIWAANNDFGLVEFPLREWSSRGAPLYSAASAIVYGKLDPFTAIERVVYFADTDTLYLTGYTDSHPRSPHEPSFGLAGTELARYDGFIAGNHSTPKYRIVLPYNPSAGEAVKAIAIAGNRVIAGVLESSGTALKKDAEDLFVYDAANGTLLGRILPGAEVGNAMGWLDCPHGLSAYRRADGEYLVFEEEVYWNKVLMFRGPLDF
jgi:hypothetical protein